MSHQPRHNRPTHILAAGGLLQRRVDGAVELALVHRRRYRDVSGEPGDYSLPKGKVEPGESLIASAVREVREETGCTGRVVGPPLFSEYLVDGVPKVVVFFPMECVEVDTLTDPDEVREVLWLGPREALARLTYPGDRTIVAQAFEES